MTLRARWQALSPREQRGDAGPLGGLGLLAAEAAAHPAAFAAHLVHAPAERAGHRLLHLGGVLGGAEQVQAVVLAGDRAGDLAFEVVMLLAAGAHAAGEAVGRGFDGGFRLKMVGDIKLEHQRIPGLRQVFDIIGVAGGYYRVVAQCKDMLGQFAAKAC